MPIITANFVTRLSGGAANATGNASLGGIKSANAMSAAVDQLFDQVSAPEAAAGDIEYRCVYLHNANAADTMTNAVLFISANTPLTSTTVDIGVGSSAVNATEQTIADENTAPVGVTFSAPSTAATGLALGTIPAGQHRAFWLRFSTTAASGSSTSDGWTFDYRCETV